MLALSIGTREDLCWCSFVYNSYTLKSFEYWLASRKVTFAVSEQLLQRQREAHEFDAAVRRLVQQAAFRAGFAARASLDGALDQA